MTEIKTAIDFDPDALRAKYQAERDKRIRSDGNEQYLEATGAFLTFQRTIMPERLLKETR